MRERSAADLRSFPRGGSRLVAPLRPGASWTLNFGTITGKTFQLDVSPRLTIKDIKTRIEEAEGIPIESQILIYNEKPLLDASVLSETGVKQDSTLQLVLQMKGGPGPPIRLRKAPKEEDTVVVLFCKQNDELFLLELMLGQDSGTTTTTAKKITPTSVSKLELDDKSINDLGSSIPEIFESLSEARDVSSPQQTTVSLKSQTASSVAVSDAHHPQSSNAGSLQGSFGTSADDVDSLDALFDDDLDFDSALLRPISTASLKSSLSGGGSSGSGSSSSSSSSKKSRPATTISLMRTRHSNCAMPFVFADKSRPNSARFAHMTSFVTAGSVGSSTVNMMQQLDSEFRQARITEFIQDAHEVREAVSPPMSEPVVEEVVEEPAPETRALAVDQAKPASAAPRSREKLSSARRRSRGSVASTVSRATLKLKKAIPAAALKPRCSKCSKKLGLISVFKCRCGKSFCGAHRYSDKHECPFDYKTLGRTELAKSNPGMRNSKIRKI